MARAKTFLFAAAVAGALSACGGSNSADQYQSAIPTTSALAPAPPPTPPAGESPERLAAIAAVSSLLSTPGSYLTLAAATVGWDYKYQQSADQCAFGGSRRVLVDNVPWYTSFPLGKHTLVATFDACRFADAIRIQTLNGSVEISYDLSAPGTVTAAVTMWQLGAEALMPALLASGSAIYSIQQSAEGIRQVIDLSPGTTLIHRRANHRIEFLGGRYSFEGSGPADANSFTEEYNAVMLDFDGTLYLLDGRLTRTNFGSVSSCTGELRITDGSGALVARRFCAAGSIDYEFIKPIPLFYE